MNKQTNKQTKRKKKKHQHSQKYTSFVYLIFVFVKTEEEMVKNKGKWEENWNKLKREIKKNANTTRKNRKGKMKKNLQGKKNREKV